MNMQFNPSFKWTLTLIRLLSQGSHCLGCAEKSRSRLPGETLNPSTSRLPKSGSRDQCQKSVTIVIFDRSKPRAIFKLVKLPKKAGTRIEKGLTTRLMSVSDT